MSFNGQSATPWQRSNLSNVLCTPQAQQIYLQESPQVSNAAIFGHGNMACNFIPTSGSGISYPQSRSSGLNSVAFQQSADCQHYSSIGTVTKITGDCGLINDDVLFYFNSCKGSHPKLGERVIFEATYSATGQFKWTATRVQIMGQHSQQQVVCVPGGGTKGSGYNAVPPPNEYRGQHGRNNSPRRSSPINRDRHFRSDRDRRDREIRNIRSRDRDDDIDHDRKRRREDRERSRDKLSNSNRGINNRSERIEKERERSVERKERERLDRGDRSPHRIAGKGRRPRAIRRYMVQIPKCLLSYKTVDVQELRQRYTTLYVPSDFFQANIKWPEYFTPDNAFSLRRPSQFHIMHKIVEAPSASSIEPLEPADADYIYSAKVMLMSCPPLPELYKKCFEDDESDNDNTIHPTRLISFLVGTRGRNEPMAIGGPWSRSLDGDNPDKDSAVLIRTAIRTCKALTGIDLSNCTQWYRFMELRYHRTDHKQKDKEDSPRIETVVVYLPNVHACMPTAVDWENLTQAYKASCERVIAQKTATLANKSSAAVSKGSGTEVDVSVNLSTAIDRATNTKPTAHEGNVKTATSRTSDDQDAMEDKSTADVDSQLTGGAGTTTATRTDNDAAAPRAELTTEIDCNATQKDQPTGGKNALSGTPRQPVTDESTKDNLVSTDTRKMTSMNTCDKMNKSQIKNQEKNSDQVEESVFDSQEKRDNKAKNAETEEHEEWMDADIIDVDMTDIVILDEYDASKTVEDAPKELDEKEKKHLIRRYTLPYAPHVIVHPSKSFKGGKFDCSVMSLSVLLDYRPEDTKERFFEVSLFAEIFNEMLVRDFGFTIYKELYLLSESENYEAMNELRSDEAGKTDAAPATQEDIDKTRERSEKFNAIRKLSIDDDSENEDDKANDKRRKCSNSRELIGRDKDMMANKKMVVVKPQLLLSFLYFDTSHCGYVFEKDLEDLFGILGLRLSRGQIRKVLSKLTIRQAYYYRKLTDREQLFEAPPTIEDANDLPASELRVLALGNKLFDIVKTSNNGKDFAQKKLCTDGGNTDLVSYNGTVVHIGKLVEQMKRIEQDYSELEKLNTDLNKHYGELQKDYTKSSTKIRDLQSELKNVNRKLSDSDMELYSLNRKYKDQLSSLSYVYNRVAPYFNREKEKDHKSECQRDKDIKKEDVKDKPKNNKQQPSREKSDDSKQSMKELEDVLDMEEKPEIQDKEAKN